jgi:hypothetical protein
MKLFVGLLSTLAWTCVHGDPAVYRPTRISYQDLVEHGSSNVGSVLHEALTTVGMVSITGLPQRSAWKDLTLASLHQCSLDSQATKQELFPDGSLRRTMATHTVPGEGGVQTIRHGVDNKVCESFQEASRLFRQEAALATQAFADRLAQELSDDSLGKTFLATSTGYSFDSFSSVVENGEHLEHFHSYSKIEQGHYEEEDRTEGEAYREQADTIELHVDQGLFIVFTPARLVHTNDGASPEDFDIARDFYIQMQDGSERLVEFDSQDDLVILLGDGINQYINPNLKSTTLRAVPHSVRIVPHSDSQARVWYGRMVLPPASAVHPASQITFGDMREQMIASSLGHNGSSDSVLTLGCSGSMVARELANTTCEGDSIYCWHRCMDLVIFNATESVCSGRKLEVSCINPRLQIWSGKDHGDYYPACADPDKQEIATPLPTLPNFPRDEETCTKAEFADFVNKVTSYDNSVELQENATLQWSVKDDEVHGRLVYNGLFGWIAFGFANVTGDKNGMHGVSWYCVSMPYIRSTFHLIPHLILSFFHLISYPLVLSFLFSSRIVCPCLVPS